MRTGMRVLLIEDDSAVAQSIELMLKSEFQSLRRTSEKKASISSFTTTTLFCSTSTCLICPVTTCSAASGVEIKTF